MIFEKPVVIIDNGRHITKAGFSSDNHPVSMFRSVVGRPSYLKGRYGREPYEVLVGDEVVDRHLDYDHFYPVADGKIVQWENIERIWHHVFYRELRVAPEDRAVLLACSPITTIQDKTKCCEVFFETLNSPSVSIQPTSVLAMYGSGATTGIVVDLGHDCSEISPIYEGGLMRYAHMSTGVAGAQINDFIRISLQRRDIQYERHIESQIVEEIKKDYLYVTPNFAMPKDKYQLTFKMPNGKKFLVRNEALLAGELFFNPNFVRDSSLKSVNPMPLPEGVMVSVEKCDVELQPELWKTVVLCGGMAGVPGLASRLQKEIENVLKHPINLVKSTEPYCVQWMGGAIFANLPDASKVFLSKKLFEEHGERIVRNLFI